MEGEVRSLIRKNNYSLWTLLDFKIPYSFSDLTDIKPLSDSNYYVRWFCTPLYWLRKLIIWGSLRLCGRKRSHLLKASALTLMKPSFMKLDCIMMFLYVSFHFIPNSGYNYLYFHFKDRKLRWEGICHWQPIKTERCTNPSVKSTAPAISFSLGVSRADIFIISVALC